MKTGAVVIAAAPPSGAGGFTPLRNIGSISIAQRVVATLRQAGVSRIVVVTGYDAAVLERHLANQGAVFLRNNDFEHSSAVDSARIGVEYLQNKCEQILLAPVEVPLFTSATVEALLSSDAVLAQPVFCGKAGYPIMMNTRFIPNFLSRKSAEKLSLAIAIPEQAVVEVPVDDPGILPDVEFSENYDDLLQRHNRQLTRPQVSAALAREVTFFDEKIAMLLELVEETSSVRTACQRMQISYSTGWNIIRILESQLACSLVVRSQGGTNGGQSMLTEYGRQLLSQYRGFKEELQRNVDNLYKKYFGNVF